MARRLSSGADLIAERMDAVRDEYRARLAKPEPPREYRWEPVAIGPTWQRAENGAFILPELTIGWDVLAWCGVWLQHGFEEPWRFTNEQARFVLWWYAIDREGEFLYHDGVLQRLKGWGKDPLGACLLAVEMLGPCRFDGFDREGNPRSRELPTAWVQTAAVSLEQTKNTMRLVPSLFSPESKTYFQIQPGKEKVYALGDTRYWEAVTSSPTTLEGARATFLLMNETQHWDSSNGGHEMDAVVRRNAAKSPDGAARTLRITNAFEPGSDSVGERDRRQWEDVQAGRMVDTGLLYDSLEAAPDAPLTVEAVPAVIESVKGDSYWLSTERIAKEVFDGRNPASQSRRFWYNQITATEDAWLSRQEWDACAVKEWTLEPGEMVTLGFDGSKNDDHSVLSACRVSDALFFPLGVWDPAKCEGGEVPMAEVDELVRKAFADFDVVAFNSDYHPFESYVDRWEHDLSANLCARATMLHPIRCVTGGEGDDSNRAAVIMATTSYRDAVVERVVKHTNDARMNQYHYNARMRATRHGVAIRKPSSMSREKIDGAMSNILAWKGRQDYLALPEGRRRKGLQKAGVFFA